MRRLTEWGEADELRWDREDSFVVELGVLQDTVAGIDTQVSGSPHVFV